MSEQTLAALWRSIESSGALDRASVRFLETGVVLPTGPILAEVDGAQELHLCIPATVDRLISESVDRVALMTKLKLEGYFPTDSASYRKVVFNVAGSALYVFDSTSPRLTPASFAPRLPAQVTRVNYAVSLDAPAPMPLEPAAADDVFEKAGSRI